MKNDLILNNPEGRTREQLDRLRALPLDQKENLSLRRIEQFCIHNENKVYVAFSGGKDSTVLLHLVRRVYPEARAVFCDTGVEFPEIKQFVKETENTVTLKPKMSFFEVIKVYGIPAISKEISQKIYELKNTKSKKLRAIRLTGGDKGNGKIPTKWLYMKDAPFNISHKCCDILKKNPSKIFERRTGLKPITGEMASESRLREATWLKQGCNSFNSLRVKSRPLSFWTDEDIWSYISKYNLEYSKIYDKGYKRTGCMFCLFGCQFDSEAGKQKFDLMKKTHPKIHKMIFGKYQWQKYIDYISEEIK